MPVNIGAGAYQPAATQSALAAPCRKVNAGQSMPFNQCRSINARRRCASRSAETGLGSRAWHSASGAGKVLPVPGGLRLRAAHPPVRVRVRLRDHVPVRARLAAAAGWAAHQLLGRRMETPCIPGPVAMDAVSGPAVSPPCRCVFHVLCRVMHSHGQTDRDKKSRLKPARVLALSGR